MAQVGSACSGQPLSSEAELARNRVVPGKKCFCSKLEVAICCLEIGSCGSLPESQTRTQNNFSWHASLYVKLGHRLL